MSDEQSDTSVIFLEKLEMIEGKASELSSDMKKLRINDTTVLNRLDGLVSHGQGKNI